MAIALHRKTGLPLIAWAAEFGEPGDAVHEHFHLGVGDPLRWLDVDGWHGEPPASQFIGVPDDVVALPVSESDVRFLFSISGVEEVDISKAAGLAVDLALVER